MNVQWLNFGRTLILGLLFGLWSAMLGGAIGFLVGAPALYPLSVAAGIASIALFVRFTHRWINHTLLVILALLNIGVMISTGIGTSNERLYYGQPEIHNIQAEQMVEYPAAAIFTLSQAMVQLDYVTTYHYTTYSPRSSNQNNHAISVAPLTSLDWQPTQPVMAWAICSDYYEYACEEWSQPIKVAMITNPIDHKPQKIAIAQNVQAHAYTAFEHAPLVYVGTSSDQIIGDKRSLWQWFWLLLNGLWAGPFLIFVGAELLWNTLKQMLAKKPS